MLALSSQLWSCATPVVEKKASEIPFPSFLTKLAEPLTETQLKTLKGSISCTYNGAGSADLTMTYTKEGKAGYYFETLMKFPEENSLIEPKEKCKVHATTIVDAIQRSTTGQIIIDSAKSGTNKDNLLFFGTTDSQDKTERPLTVVFRGTTMQLASLWTK